MRGVPSGRRICYHPSRNAHPDCRARRGRLRPIAALQTARQPWVGQLTGARSPGHGRRSVRWPLGRSSAHHQVPVASPRAQDEPGMNAVIASTTRTRSVSMASTRRNAQHHSLDPTPVGNADLPTQGRCKQTAFLHYADAHRKGQPRQASGQIKTRTPDRRTRGKGSALNLRPDR